MNKKEELISSLTQEQKQALLDHFNEIYECNELTDHEYKIIYLAWLWANGLVYELDDGWYAFDEDKTGMSIKDYDITFEAEPSGGANLDLFYDYYNLDKMIKLMGW